MNSSKISSKKITFEIPESLDNQRIDQALLECPEITSRNQAQKLLKSGYIRWNNKTLKPSFCVSRGMIVDIEIPQTASGQIQPYAYRLNIIYEDQQIIVVNKPAGLVVHPSYGHENETLVNALIHHCKDLSVGFSDNRPGLVHRLDKDTSGVLVVAKTDLAQNSLAKQFQKKTTHRKYWALVYGALAKKEARIESLLARHPTDRKKFASLRKEGSQKPYLQMTEWPQKENPSYDPPSDIKYQDSPSKGKRAITHYKVLFESLEFSLIELQLETGRTHQIRIHMSELGHPIVGDEIYGGKSRANNCKSIKLRNYIKSLPRFALHAKELGFKHPTKPQRTHFHCAWPDDLIELASLCKIELPQDE